jgi:glutathione reductase (NADPH)
MSDTSYDLITLGAGSGGVAASRRAASHGAKVAIVEGRRVGGTCVLRGCVPKKLLMYAAQMRDAFDQARGYGWSLDAPTFDMSRWAAAKASETARLEGAYRALLRDAGVTLVEGWARLEADRSVVVGGQRLRARHVLIATGSSPVTDSIPGIELCATSDDLLDLQTLPRRAAVIGGGYVGVEFASMLSRLGVEVTLFFRDRAPLRGFDEVLRSAASGALQTAGVSLNAGVVPIQVQRAGAGLRLVFAQQHHLDVDWVLNATGRRPNTRGLGLAVDAQGAIPVDDALQTASPGVYAVGDVTNRKNLTPVAIAEGRALADSLFGPTRHRVDLSLVPSAVFMLPPIGAVGPTEAEALAVGHTLRIYEANFKPMKQAFAGGSERTQMKLLVDDASDRVLAAHMIGTDAPEIVQSLAVALTAGATKQHFDRTMALHPTAAEEFVLMRTPSRVVVPSR